MVAALAQDPVDAGEIAVPVAPQAAPEPNPIAALVRAMRGRWFHAMGGAAILAPALATGGFLAGVELYDSQAILRVFPQESNILYATGDDSVLKTFDSFVKAETSYVASHQVMARATEDLRAAAPGMAADLEARDLAGSIEIKRNDSLIVLTTMSRDAGFATAKLEAVIASYLALKSEADEARSAVRLAELKDREAQLVERIAALTARQLEVGGEFGNEAIAKAHVEKIAQIDALAARKSEVAATLATLEADAGTASIDMSDQEILRATLLDRSLADLNFSRAKLMTDLAGLRALYAEHMPAIRFKLEEIAVIEAAMSERREQIRILGQTGALTDTSGESSDASLAEIRALYTKLDGQLGIAREEARDLNRRRFELNAIEKESDEAQDLLEETRRALEVIKLESGRALPGFTVLMSPPTQAAEPSDDNRKILAAAGLAGGVGLALVATLGLGLIERRIRFAETLAPHAQRLPVLQVSPAPPEDAQAADRLRNEIQLRPLRAPRLVGRAPVIAVTRAETGDARALARALGESYARARIRTLLVEADLGTQADEAPRPGFREALLGADVEPVQDAGQPCLLHLSSGRNEAIIDGTAAAPSVRSAIDRLARGVDVVIIHAGSLEDRLASQFVLSAADIAVAEVRPSDRRTALRRHIDRLDTLPRHGSVAVLRGALPADPWIAVRS